jgi:hypothetical protein
MMRRRDFMKTSAFAVAGGIFLPQSGFGQLTTVTRIGVRLQARESARTRLAVNELCSGLHRLNGTWDVREIVEDERNGVQLTLSIDSSSFKGPEDYEISAAARGVRLSASNEQACCTRCLNF